MTYNSKCYLILLCTFMKRVATVLVGLVCFFAMLAFSNSRYICSFMDVNRSSVVVAGE